MAEFTVTVEGVDAAVARFSAVTPKLRTALANMVKRLQVDLVNSARGFYDSVLKVRTGALKGSIQAGEFNDSGNEISASVVAGGGDAFYARAQEYGATISAKNVQNLTIPLDAATTALGVGRFSARQVISDPAQFGFTGTFFKHGVLFGEQAVSGKRKGGTLPGVVPLFILKPTVTLPPRPFMRPAFEQIVQRLPDEGQKAIDEAMK